MLLVVSNDLGLKVSSSIRLFLNCAKIVVIVVDSSRCESMICIMIVLLTVIGSSALRSGS